MATPPISATYPLLRTDYVEDEDNHPQTHILVSQALNALLTATRGKELNDFLEVEKQKLAGIADGATVYTNAMAQGLIDAALSPIMAIIGSAGGDADAFISNVREILTLLSNFPEGVNLLTRLAGIDAAILASSQATVALPLNYDPASPSTSYFKLTYAPNATTGVQEVSLIDLFIDRIAQMVLANITLATDGATNKLTLARGYGLADLVVTIGTTGSAGSTTPAPGLTYSALTASGFTNKDTGTPLTYVAGPPSYWLAGQADWTSGANTGKWNLRLPAGTVGAARYSIINADINLAGLTLRTIDTFDHSKGNVNAQLYVANGKIGWVDGGVNTDGTITAVAGQFLLLSSDGTTLSGYRSVDGVALTELVHTFTSVTPASQALYLGQNGHFGSKIGTTAQASFVAY